MKTIIKKIVGVTALFVVLSAVAQTESTTEDTTTAQLIPWNSLPASGTFWVEGPSGFTDPYPCRPQYMPGASVYALSDDSFVVDARTVKNYALLSMSAMSLNSATTSAVGGGFYQPDAQGQYANSNLQRLV